MLRLKIRLTEQKQTIIGVERIAFEWAKIKKDTYIVYMPKIFRKEEGGSVVIISEKKMLKLFETVGEIK